MRVGLSGGAYQARSVIASAQRSLNLYGEGLPTGNQYTGATGLGEPAQYAYYPTPGIRLLLTLPKGPVRGIKQASNGNVYAVGGDTVYQINVGNWTSTSIGSIAQLRPYPVSMQDNGLTMFVVDGTAGGWTIDLPSNAFAAFSDESFYGADKVDYLDTFLIFNKPNTPQFYWSGSLAKTFDSLDFANKQSFSDLLVTLAVVKREIWLFGDRTTEIFYDSGASDTGAGSSQFQQVQGVFVDHGIKAKYSLATYDNSVYWLSADRAGQGIVLTGAGYQTKRISTFAIEAELTRYSQIGDAIGFVYSLGGHVFYVLTFPSADKTWCYDITTGQWNEWAWLDTNGKEHRHRANCACSVFGLAVVGDWQNGNVYVLDPNAYTDNGQPIKRQRAFPHLINEMDRVFYRQFIADMDVGTLGGFQSYDAHTVTSSDFVGANGTRLSAYTDPDTGATFTPIGGQDNAQISDNRATRVTTGPAQYQVSGTPDVADYQVFMEAWPLGYGTMPVGQTIYVAGRCTGANTGYAVTLGTDGTQYQLTLSVRGGATSQSVSIGTLTAGCYLVFLNMQGQFISARVQQSISGLWFNGYAWTDNDQAVPLGFNDATYAGPGTIMIGGNWP